MSELRKDPTVNSAPAATSEAMDRAMPALLPSIEAVRIGVVGLGYVGLPVAVELAEHFDVVGFDVDPGRLSELSRGYDRTGEVREDQLTARPALSFTHQFECLETCNFYIVTVPTPIDAAKQPDFSALISASEIVGSSLKRGDVVVYESTVYPGATEEICVPVLSRGSGLRFNEDFFVGYSPERINPGDPDHRLRDIVKVVSGSTPEVADLIQSVYGKIIVAGTHRVSSIRAAEAAKVIENIQRDVNIALVNELALLFKVLGLETREVLEAAGTKWNFHKYVPGLVGGHCIGVDPYYLTHKAQSVGFHADMILAGRRINDGMARAIADDLLRGMLEREHDIARSKVLIMGATFKNDCPDLRNTKVADLAQHLRNAALSVTVYDPLADPIEAQNKYGFNLVNEIPEDQYQAIVLAVNHREIISIGVEKLRSLLVPNGLIYDMKSILSPDQSDMRI